MARPRIVRPKEAMDYATPGEILELALTRRPLDYDADCVRDGTNAHRPCPFVGCKYNLYLDVDPRTGSLKLNFPDLEVDQIPETCSIDVARRGGHILEDVGAVMNLTRERVRQLEEKTLAKLPDRVRAAVGHIIDPEEI